jgi:hypothetical protein
MFNSTLVSLDELLHVLGFDSSKTLIVTFILPSINVLGIVFCSISTWIFFRKTFEDPVFFYYRLLCLVYILHLIHNIPHGILFSPQYFPTLDSYSISLFQIYYAIVSANLYQYEDTLQMGILLTRMRIFSPFVRRHFTASPKLVSLAFLITCLCINVIFAFGFKVSLINTFYFMDINGMKQNVTFYYATSSDFSASLVGKILSGVTSVFLNLFLTLVVGIALNVASVCQYKTYIRKKSIKEKAFRLAWYSKQMLTDGEASVKIEMRELTPKEINEHKTERNLFLMALTLCTISILSRIVFVFCYINYFFYNSFSNNLLVFAINYSIYTLVPTVGIFVFYAFNKMFRQEFKKKILNQKSKHYFGKNTSLT